MEILIRTDNNISGSDALHERVESDVRDVLKRFETRLTRVEVFLHDVNSHKKGETDKRCTMEARIRGLPPIAATHDGPTISAAVKAAADKLAKSLDSQFGRLGNVKDRTSFNEFPIP